jgi:predicted tellurium resistance membrane protein TerC
MTIDAIITLLILILLQAVLGVDNLLYISLESKQAPAEKQKKVRFWGITIAIVFRLILLYLLLLLIDLFQSPIFEISKNNVFHGSFNMHSIIVYVGGGFIVWTAIKEIWHMISLGHETEVENAKTRPLWKIVGMIVVMNIVFSFDSILSAIALTKNVWLMSIATVIGGFVMIWLSEKVSVFLNKNRMYEVLGLFILLLVGFMLLTEAAHLSHLTIFEQEIHAMSKATFYFVLVILIVVDIVQTKYQKNLLNKQKK